MGTAAIFDPEGSSGPSKKGCKRCKQHDDMYSNMLSTNLFFFRQAAAYWKKNEKEEIEQRKRAEREAIEKAKADEAAREKARAAKRLQFLLDSGETYSKLMLKKIKSKCGSRERPLQYHPNNRIVIADDAMDSNDTAVDPNTMGPDADDDMDIDEDFDEADIEVNEDGEPECRSMTGFDAPAYPFHACRSRSGRVGRSCQTTSGCSSPCHYGQEATRSGGL
jgi:hypothetical protein